MYVGKRYCGGNRCELEGIYLDRCIHQSNKNTDHTAGTLLGVGADGPFSDGNSGALAVVSTSKRKCWFP